MRSGAMPLVAEKSSSASIGDRLDGDLIAADLIGVLGIAFTDKASASVGGFPIGTGAVALGTKDERVA